MEMKNTETPMPIDDSAELLAALKKISARAVLARQRVFLGRASVDEIAEDIVQLLATARRRELPIESAIIEKLTT